MGRGRIESTKFHTMLFKVVCGMKKVGVWERDEGIFETVEARVKSRGEEIELLRGRHPADFSGKRLDLLCISPGATGWAGLGAVDCRVLLLPGAAGPLARGLRCACAVSYGTSPKDTLTFSSLEGEQLCAALQRELVTLDGGVVEQQEFVLTFPPERSPLICLAELGTLLLLGEKP